AQLANLAAGQYELTVSDALGTKKTAILRVEQPDPIKITLDIKSNATTDNADGKVETTVRGGSGGFTYQWDNGETTATAEKLNPSTHTVTVTDSNGCSATAEVEITEDILPLSVSLSQAGQINCSGEANMSLTVEIEGGKGPFQTKWNQAALNGENPTNLSGGEYIVTVTDALGTTADAAVRLVEPDPLELTATVLSAANTNASDGRAIAAAAGGTGNYKYAWDNNETKNEASQLAPGSHSVTVTDENGCTASVSIDISEDIKELAFGFRQTTAIECAGDATAGLSVEVKGGKSPFTYAWSDNSLSGAEVSNLKAGTYSVTVSDVSGQSLNAAITVEQPEPLSIEVLRKRPAFDAYEEDGLAEIKVKGGTIPYKTTWDTGELGELAKKLKVGNHSVTVSDGKGCSISETIEIKKKLLQALQAGRLRAGQTLQLKNLNFPADSTQMTAESLPILEEVREFLQDNPTITLEVGGHTNSTPPAAYCDQLSTARAKNVATYIMEGSGLDPKRISYVGYGKRKPIATNKTADGRRRNQRVEIKVLTL
ncbi:MAG: OmpA family protein, partial [Saprospiraceae bacterium]